MVLHGNLRENQKCASLSAIAVCGMLEDTEGFTAAGMYIAVRRQVFAAYKLVNYSLGTSGSTELSTLLIDDQHCSCTWRLLKDNQAA